MQQTKKRPREKWARFTISSLEADVAYFDARLALLRKKNSTYHQLAQVKAYTELEHVLSRMLARLKGTSARSDALSGIEVSEESDSRLAGDVTADSSSQPAEER